MDQQGYLPDDEDGAITHDMGSGHQRRFSPAQVLALRHMSHLVGMGLMPERAADAAAEAYRIWSGEWQHTVGDRVHDLSSLTLLWRLPPSQTAELRDVLEVGLP